jgi:hypothetical protein
MKRMMIIAGSLLVAAFVNAGTVNWGASTINSANGGVASSSGTWYVFALGGSSAIFGNDSFNILSLTLTTDVGTALTPVGGAGSPYTVTKESYWDAGEVGIVWANIDGSDTTSTSIVNQWWAVVFVDGASTGYYGIDVFQVKDLNAQANPADFWMDDFDLGAFTTVPEPTSMALLALGAAALGLRRRSRR